MNRKCDDPAHEWETREHPGRRPYRRCRTCRLASNRKSTKETHRRRREQALDAYGRSCACCGEPDSRFLAIDHIDGGGNKQRRDNGWSGSQQFYRWLESEGYPPGFQTLCHNCNHAKHVYGECPHAADRS